MEKIYSNNKCKSCKKEFVLLIAEVQDTLREGKYLSCPHCGSKHLVKTTETDNLKECMKHDSYKREHGALRQVKNE